MVEYIVSSVGIPFHHRLGLLIQYHSNSISFIYRFFCFLASRLRTQCRLGLVCSRQALRVSRSPQGRSWTGVSRYVCLPLFVVILSLFVDVVHLSNLIKRIFQDLDVVPPISGSRKLNKAKKDKKIDISYDFPRIFYKFFCRIDTFYGIDVVFQ